MARKILLADDSVTAQNMGRKILSDAGYDVVTVNNGSAALKRVAEQRPDLIVLDVYMPGYSGLEVCQRLKDSAETAGIPILLTVGKLEPFKPEEARRVRAEAYIVKPFEASELLSALTKLEDQVVPGSSDGGRFSGSVSGVEHFDDRGRKSEPDSTGDPDTGWKNRLRFPSKKKRKEELEAEPEEEFVAGPNIREFRRSRSNAQKPGAAPEKAAPASPVVPEIPRDITPEELDALSALAAKLDGEAAPTESSNGVAAVEAVEAAASASPASNASQKEFEVTAPAVDDPSASRPAAPSKAESVPTESAVPAAEVPATEPASADLAAKQPEAAPREVETLAEKAPEPADPNDVPSFAVAPTVAEPAPQNSPAVPDAPASGAVGERKGAAGIAESPAQAGEKKADESPVEQKSKAEQTPKAEEVVSSGNASAGDSQAEPGGPAPSAEELAAALRLLTPSAADASSTPSRDTLVTAGAMLAAEAAQNASAALRWMAETVAVSPEEAARSLEAEMFKMLAGHEASGESIPASRSQTETAADEARADTIAAIPPMATQSAAAAADGERQSAKQETEDAAPADAPAAATFADAVHPADEAPVSVMTKTEPAGAATEGAGLPVAETTALSTSEAATGGEEDMSKEREKSNWHQIRAGAPAANDPLEAAKQAEAAAEEAPKAMAAAAASDPGAIANIVDSVLADLRPKIVEEIAKKLAGK